VTGTNTGITTGTNNRRHNNGLPFYLLFCRALLRPGHIKPSPARHIIIALFATMPAREVPRMTDAVDVLTLRAYRRMKTRIERDSASFPYISNYHVSEHPYFSHRTTL
jgi:hypothetical protein